MRSSRRRRDKRRWKGSVTLFHNIRLRVSSPAASTVGIYVYALREVFAVNKRSSCLKDDREAFNEMVHCKYMDR